MIFYLLQSAALFAVLLAMARSGASHHRPREFRLLLAWWIYSLFSLAFDATATALHFAVWLLAVPLLPGGHGFSRAINSRSRRLPSAPLSGAGSVALTLNALRPYLCSSAFICASILLLPTLHAWLWLSALTGAALIISAFRRHDFFHLLLGEFFLYYAAAGILATCTRNWSHFPLAALSTVPLWLTLAWHTGRTQFEGARQAIEPSGDLPICDGEAQ